MLVDAGTRVHEGSGWDDLVENEMVAPSPPPPIPLAIPLTLLGPGGAHSAPPVTYLPIPVQIHVRGR